MPEFITVFSAERCLNLSLCSLQKDAWIYHYVLCRKYLNLSLCSLQKVPEFINVFSAERRMNLSLCSVLCKNTPEFITVSSAERCLNLSLCSLQKDAWIYHCLLCKKMLEFITVFSAESAWIYHCLLCRKCSNLSLYSLQKDVWIYHCILRLQKDARSPPFTLPLTAAVVHFIDDEAFGATARGGTLVANGVRVEAGVGHHVTQPAHSPVVRNCNTTNQWTELTAF